MLAWQNKDYIQPHSKNLTCTGRSLAVATANRLDCSGNRTAGILSSAKSKDTQQQLIMQASNKQPSIVQY